MRRGRRIGGAALAALALGWLLLLSCRESEQPADTAAAPEVETDAELAAEEADTPVPEDYLDPEAVEVLKRMVKAFEAAEKLQVRVEDEYDALQADEETLSFGRTSVMTLRRSDRLRVERTDRSGSHRITSYDGSRIVVYDATKNVYAAVERSGDVDSILAFLRDEVGMKLPLAELFSQHLGALLLENVTSARYIGSEVLDGSEQDHIAYRYGEGVGIQIWVPRAGDALPRRMVMTFEDAAGRPQYRADFGAWNLAPDVADAVFAFQPPEGARKIAFVLPKRAEATAAGEEESR